MQPPSGLSPEEATDQALQAASMDLAQPGWGYLGGTNTFEVGVPISFAIYVEPGDYVFAASYYAMEQGAEETMTLARLTVTASATPVAAEASPVASAPMADVTLEMTDDLARVRSGPRHLRGDLLHHRPGNGRAARARRHGDHLRRRIGIGR